jgi:hypothetical protein
MKNSYFNGMLNFRFELGVIKKKKKQKYVVKIPQKRRKIRRKCFKKLTHNIPFQFINLVHEVQL